MSSSSEPSPRRHILTVAVEDWFQVGAFHRLVQQQRWYRFETRVESNIRRTLDLLDERGAKATFFSLGWIADELPEVIREIADRGHEVASKGYYHRSIAAMTPGEFRDDLIRSREALERASGRGVLGYRVADGWFGSENLWALDVLAAEGFAYDSSICPLGRVWSREPGRRFLHEHRAADGRTIREVPLSSARIGGIDIPIAGGNWFRQFPHPLMMHAFRRWEATREEPFVMYFQVWELDPEQPRVQAAGPLTRLRHYRNLGKLTGILRDYLAAAEFGSVADRLGLETPRLDAALPPATGRPAPPPRSPAPISIDRGEPLTLVVPCYNEELVLPYLARTLDDLERRFAGRRDLRYVFVDDGSTDRTGEALADLFGSRRGCRIVRHAGNRGVARAILTGIEASGTEIVASIDCDCTYDPRQLENLLACMDGADLVTASPYHPEGEVRNVPFWRLFLSRGLSRIYRWVLRCDLSTYTSCFRIYRRSALVGLPIREEGFLGVAETLGRLVLRGGRIVECPAVLEVRMLGRSKMKILRTVLGHLRLLARLAALRATGGPRGRSPSEGRRART